MLVLKKLKRQNVIEHEDLLFWVIDVEDRADLSQLYYVNAVVIDNPSNSICENIIAEIKKHHNPNVYLKPIFVVNHPSLNKRVISSCDELTDLVQLKSISVKTRYINERISVLSQLQRFPNPQMEYLYKTLQYMYSRSMSLIPVPDRTSRIGYHFPFISQQFKDIDNQKVFELLKFAEQEGYVKSTLLDKAHLCSSCGSAHHNIRETCLHCNSIDLKLENLIHHFKCAYIGPETDFTSGDSDDLICPKCDRSIRHIGVDYDKPSHIYHCNSCAKHFQDPHFTSMCLDCSDEKDIHHLLEHEVRTFDITTKGEHLVIKGLRIDPKEENPNAIGTVGVYAYNVFKHLLRQEQARAKHGGTTSLLGEINVSDIHLKRMNDYDLQVLQHELCLIIKSYLKETDIVTSVALEHYYFIITDTNLNATASIKELMESNISMLLKSNLNSAPEVHVTFKDISDSNNKLL